MVLFLGFAIVIVVYILFAYFSYKLWEFFFDTIFETFNKCMKIASIILGIILPITFPILIIVTIIYLLYDLSK